MARSNIYRVLGICVFSSCLAGGALLAPIARGGNLLPSSAARTLADEKKDEKKDDKKKEDDEPKGDPIDVDKLPKAVVDAVKKAYPGAKITKASKLEDGNYFLDDVAVGKKVWDLTVTPAGKIVKEVEMKEGA